MSGVAIFLAVTATVGYDAGNLPKIFVDGKPQYPFIDVCGCSSTGGCGQQWVDDYVKRATEIVGPRILQMGFEDKDYLKPDGSYDWSVLDCKAAATLAVVPDAQLMVNIRFRYEAWAKAHPDEQVVYGGEAMSPGSPDEWAGAPVRPSSASIPFREQVIRDLVSMAAHVKAASWGERVVGVRINYGVATEWFTYGVPAFPDMGKPMTRWFREYLAAKYKTDAALRKAWADEAVTLATATVPDRNDRTTGALFLDAAKNRRTIDFNMASAESMADLMIALATVTKRELPGRIVGVYYGYMLNSWPGNSANYLVDKVLASGVIDFFSDPPDYHRPCRRAGGDYGHKTVVATLRRYGKIAIIEDDSRLSFMTNWAPKGWCMADAREDRAILRRNVLNTLFDREGYQVCDPLAGRGEPGRPHCFDDLNALSSQREAFDVLGKVMSVPTDSGADLALVFNYRDKFYCDSQIRNRRNLDWWALNRDLPLYFHKTGAAFDILTLDDLLASKKDYRRFIFLNGFALTADERAVLKRLTRRPGVAAAWFLMPGAITEAGFSDAAMSDLVGMGLKGAGVNPDVVSADPSATAFADAGGGWEKTLDGGAKAVFVPGIIRDVEGAAAVMDRLGEFRYTAAGPYVRRHGDCLMVHVATAGTYRVTLPPADCGRTLAEQFTGRTYGPGSATLTSDGPETWFFRIR